MDRETGAGMHTGWWQWLAEVTPLRHGDAKPHTRSRSWFSGWSILRPHPSIWPSTHRPAHSLHQEVPATPPPATQALAQEECSLTLPVGALVSRPWQERGRLSQQEAGRGSSCPLRWSQGPGGGGPLPPLILRETLPPAVLRPC